MLSGCCSVLLKMKNILMIGETGVGKSSVINLIKGCETATVSGKATRGTFSTEMYEYGDFRLVDTVGYNDAAEQSSKESLKNLKQLAIDVEKDGIALIVYVMKRGRINASSKKNYEYFVSKACKDKVPVLLVVTHCEKEHPKNNWYSAEKITFESLGMHFKDAVCGCCMKLDSDNLDPDLLPFYKLKRDRTQEQIRGKIYNLALEDPWKPYSLAEFIEDLLVNVAVVFAFPFFLVADFAVEAGIKLNKAVSNS